MIQEHGRKHNLPVSASERSEGICLRAFPVVELTDQIYLGGIRRPLAEHPVALCITVKSVIYMVIHSPAQGAVHRQPVLEGKDHLVTSVNDILVRLEPLVGVIDHLILLCTHIYNFTVSRAPRRYARHASSSSLERFTYLSISSTPVFGSSTLAAIASSSSTAFA